MTIKTTSKLTSTFIILFILFILLNLFELVMGYWRHYILVNIISSEYASLYYFMIEIELKERMVHFVLNYASLILLVVWFHKQYKNMRLIDAGFKANKVLVYLFWLIPIYESIYIFRGFRRIIRVGNRHGQLGKRLNRLNFMILICHIGSYSCWLMGLGIFLLYRFDQRMTERIMTNALFSFIAVFGVIVSILSMLFFRNYRKLESKLVSDYHSEPELNESDLIDR